MKINTKTKNFLLTPSITYYLEEKLNSLNRFLSRHENVFVDVELAKTTRHHQKGDIYKAEINLKIPGHLIRAMAEEWDLRVAIDKVKDELQRKIKDNKEKKLSLYKKGARMLKKFLRRK